MNLYDFAAIVRTQGKHPDLLQGSLQSLSFQQPECLAVIVVHESEKMLPEIESICNKIINLNYIVLHAGDRLRKRGYPLNIGLNYCYTSGNKFKAIFFLDDDDIVYPFFTRKMSQALDMTEGDLIYAASNRRQLGQPIEKGYQPKHISNIFIENFIPINSYSVRFSLLKENNLLFDEELDYTEDWHFLLQLLEKGFRFEPLHETLSEFRIIADGNTEIKEQPEIWKQSSLKIRSYINNTNFSINGHVIVESLMNSESELLEHKDEIVCHDTVNTPAMNPKSRSIARKIWNKLPLSVKVKVKNSYVHLLDSIGEYRN